jgi:hypothetical protein
VFGLGYRHSVGIVGVDFLALGIGMMAAMIATVKVQDAMFPKPGEAKRSYKPESRYVRASQHRPVGLQMLNILLRFLLGS